MGVFLILLLNLLKDRFGTSPRGMENMSKTLPGPGSYNLKSMFEGSNGSNFRGTSLTPRRPDSALTNASRTPGPGAYNPIVQDRIRSPSYR